MKKNLFIATFILLATGIFAQNRVYKYNFSAGASIQHYNGNLGNSMFQFNTTCFAGVTSSFGVYLNRSFDFNFLGSVGHFGYCQTDADKNRVVSLNQRCPGCTDRLGMGELRSLLVSGVATIKYKFANGYFLKEDSKFVPYVYAGAGACHLADNMKKNCVNVGMNYTINGGAGIRYNLCERMNITYNVGVACFMARKVYYTNAMTSDANMNDEDDKKMEKRKDLCLQNSITLGFNF